MNRENLYKELPKLRKKYNISIAYLAYKLGYHPLTIIMWERRERTPKQPTIDKLNRIFNGFKTAKKKEK